MLVLSSYIVSYSAPSSSRTQLFEPNAEFSVEEILLPFATCVFFASALVYISLMSIISFFIKYKMETIIDEAQMIIKIITVVIFLFNI